MNQPSSKLSSKVKRRTKFSSSLEVLKESRLAGILAKKIASKYPYYLVKSSPKDFAKFFAFEFTFWFEIDEIK